MRFNLVLAALLCFTTWMTMVHASNGGLSSCCLLLSTTRVNMTLIVNYTDQTDILCPVKAVVFLTKNGSHICSDPNSKWAIKVRRNVDKEREKRALQETPQTEEGSASDITPAVASASKNTPQQKRRNGRQHQRKKSRKGRKGQRKAM